LAWALFEERNLVSVFAPDLQPAREAQKAATAAFLLALLAAVLPFFFSAGVTNPSPPQVAPDETSVVNAGDGVYSSMEQASLTQFFSPIGVNSTGPYLLASSPNLTVTVQTEASLTLQRNPVALGNTVLFTMSVSPSLLTSNDRFGNLRISVGRPDGTVEILGAFQSEPNGRQSVYYTPDLIGEFKIQLAYGGQFFGSSNVTYLGSVQ
jgi:hypothetical protein